MRRVSGEQFDPAILDAFLEVDLAEYDALNEAHGTARAPAADAPRRRAA
jgi:HD-GYP domain-containing protein (c-di-GMP phosphodiesterase class II)